MDRRKQLKEAYKQQKPQMGIIEIKCLHTGISYLFCAKDVRGETNSILARLGSGMSQYGKLQESYKLYGREGLQVGVAAELEYGEDTEADYSDDLELLRMELLEKNENAVPLQRTGPQRKE